MLSIYIDTILVLHKTQSHRKLLRPPNQDDTIAHAWGKSMFTVLIRDWWCVWRDQGSNLQKVWSQNLCMQSPKLGHSLENSQLEKRIHHYSITKKTRSLKVQNQNPVTGSLPQPSMQLPWLVTKNPMGKNKTKRKMNQTETCSWNCENCQRITEEEVTEAVD